MSERVDTNITLEWTKPVEIPSKLRPTPRTDAIHRECHSKGQSGVPTGFARALEREADELREALELTQEGLKLAGYSSSGEMLTRIAASLRNTEPKES